jgi:class 3 adenylate cyclase
VDWEQTGLLVGAPDLDVRRALLDHLVALGYPLELLHDAHRQGRLYALGGDQVIRPGRLTVTLTQLAERLQQDLPWTRRIWRALGLTDPGVDVPVATEAEVEAYTIWGDIRALLGDDAALALARVHGAAMARMTEAVGAAMSSAMPEMDLVHGGDELTTARAYEAVAQLVPRVTGVLDLLYRQHLGEATRYFEAAHAPAGFGSHPVPYCVAFADLCGFTAATESLSAGELTALLAVFESTAYDEAAGAGGRCVKLIGDAAMLVCASPDGLAQMAHRVVDRMCEENSLLPVRVAMAAGDVFFRDGDYFGAPVNLAARLLSLTGPGEVVADAQLATRLDPGRWRVVPKQAQPVKGVTGLVIPQVVERA